VFIAEASTLKMNRNEENAACVFTGSKNDNFEKEEEYVCAEAKRGTLARYKRGTLETREVHRHVIEV